MNFHLPAMACGGCLRSVTLAIRAVDPEAEVTADMGQRRIEVTSKSPRDRLAAALADIGFAPSTGDI